MNIALFFRLASASPEHILPPLVTSMKLTLLASLSTTMSIVSAAPPTEKKPVTDEYHGVKVVDECRETTGKTLTFFKSTDRIIVDGLDELRTQTKSSGPCATPPAAR